MENKSDVEKTTIPYYTIATQSVPRNSVFNKFCLCIPLRTACFILGYFSLVINSYDTLGLIGFTTSLGLATNGFDHFDENATAEIFDETYDDDDKKLALNFFTIAVFVVTIFNVFWLTLNIACLVGLHKKRVSAIKPYVIFLGIRVVLSLASFIHLAIVSKSTVQYILTNSSNTGFSACFIYVFYRYMQQLTREKKVEEDQKLVVSKEFCIQQS